MGLLTEFSVGAGVSVALGGDFMAPTDPDRMSRSLGSLMTETCREGDSHPGNTYVHLPRWSKVASTLKLNRTDEDGLDFASLKVVGLVDAGTWEDILRVRAIPAAYPDPPQLVLDVKLSEWYPTRYYSLGTKEMCDDARLRTKGWASLFFSRQKPVA
jgi:hypothetical protein